MDYLLARGYPPQMMTASVMKAAERKFEQGFTKWLREKFNKQQAFWISKFDDEKSGKPNLDLLKSR